jgi:predicted PurR-regulated permease PerM
LSLDRQLRFWIGALVALVLFLWLFSDILLPFVVGMALAYLLDPVADRLERLGLGRTSATLVIMVLFLASIGLAFALLVPLVIEQANSLGAALPDLVQRLERLAHDLRGTALGREVVSTTQAGAPGRLGTLFTQGLGWATQVLGSLWSTGQAVFSVLSLAVIAPIVAFYLLLDWDRMVERVDGWLPLRHRDTIRRLARDMDAAVAGFVRGQISVCLVMGAFYAIGLTLVGLNFGLVIGIVSGILGFVPFVGFLVGIVSSVGVALVQFWPDWPWILAVLGIFLAGQILEGYVLQPNWIGKSVGLHPVWLLFALLAFGSLFGFVGALVAVPTAASIAVIARFALDRYLDSSFYRHPVDEP